MMTSDFFIEWYLYCFCNCESCSRMSKWEKKSMMTISFLIVLVRISRAKYLITFGSERSCLNSFPLISHLKFFYTRPNWVVHPHEIDAKSCKSATGKYFKAFQTHGLRFLYSLYLFQNWNFRICGVFLIDSHFMVDGAKFLSASMAALSVMVNLEIPHVNVLSKVDLLSKSAR